MGSFLWPPDAPAAAPFGPEINRTWLADEASVVREMLPLARLDEAGRAAVEREAVALVEAVRAARRGAAGIEAFLQQYDLGSREGVILMCIAEALLRIPDADTADRLIADKISGGRWEDHLGAADSLFVNASTWGLMLTGRLVRPESADLADPGSFVRRLAGRLGEPVVRAAFRQAMKIMGHQFVMGRTIDEALKRASSASERRYRTPSTCWANPRSRCATPTATSTPTAPRSFRGRHHEGGRAGGGRPASRSSSRRCTRATSSPSVAACSAELVPQLESLATGPCRPASALTVDAEEADRLELSPRRVRPVLAAPALAGWDGGFGLAVQAYQKRAPPCSTGWRELADATGMPVMVRLVKGAYWDTRSSARRSSGLDGYPVFTRKASDRRLLPRLRAAAARRDPRPVPAVRHAQRAHAGGSSSGPRRRDFEFQRLHGMGEALYDGWDADGGRPAASTRRSAATRTCCPTWCAGCWRTAPTPPSSTAS
jgi:RHH-type transcriptional regulator, proline utilization regulon repressor / proline dehydrogenase / delta 1-pyrroline-5-carboxylate dehydrogenase